MTPRAHRICLWMGPALTAIYLVGFIFLAQFAPIPSPDWSAQRLTQWIIDHRSGYEVGCLLMLIAGAMLAPWGASLSIWTRKTEARFPVIYVTQIVSLAASVALFVLIAIIWGLAAFRAGEISPEITQTLFDGGWFAFLWAGPPFYVWAISIGIGILVNPSEHQLFPRWVGYFCIASPLCWSMDMVMIFFREGPASYAGVLPTWIPLGEFFAWMVIMSVLGLRAISRQEAMCREETGEGLGVYAPSWDDPVEAPSTSDGNGRVAEPVIPRVPVAR